MPLIQWLPEQARLIETDLQKNYADLLPISGGLWQQIGESVQSWQHQTRLSLLQEEPFEHFEQQFLNQKQLFDLKEVVFNQNHIAEYKKFCQSIGVPFDDDFWHKQLNQYKQKGKENPKRVAWQLLLEQWQKQLDQAKAEWYLQKLNALRQQFLNELEKWLEIIRQLSKQLNEFGFDIGLFWGDDTIGKLTPQAIDEFKRWSEYLKNDKNAQKIAELLGKMRQIEQSEKIEQVQKTISVSTPTIDINSREEIIGVRLGKELEYLLPSELALMSNEETSILFDLKYLENKLMCFELQGIQYQDEEVEIMVEQKTSEDEKLGPMILCVDTSGSMQGLPENIAKAMVLFLANKAKSERRDCFVINFSVKIDTFEVNDKTGISDLINFLKMSFHGDNDMPPAFYYALDLMNQENYKRADVLLISDFLMDRLSDDILEKIALQRKNGNKFNSLVIGNTFLKQYLGTHFDHEWIYNPYSKNIQELVQFKKNLS